MIDLILSMLVAFDKYKTELGFSKKDIDNLIKKYNILKEFDCNERGWIVLWKNKYVSNEEFAKKMDLEFDDNSFWIVEKDFENLLPKSYETEAKILDGTLEWYSGDFYKVKVEDFFDSYNEKTLQEIINYCDKNELEIDVDNQTIPITKENTKIIKNEIIINDNIKLVDEINQLDELYQTLNGAICNAQESADQNEIYQRVKNNFINEVGPFKRKKIKIDGKDKQMLFVRFDGNWNDIEKDLIDSYGDYEFQDENYGNLKYLLDENDYFEFRKPDYDYIYGTIDNDILNEYTQSNLSY